MERLRFLDNVWGQELAQNVRDRYQQVKIKSYCSNKKIKARRNKQIKGGAKEKGSPGILRSLSLLSLFTFLVRQSFWHVEKIRMVGGREKVCAAKNSFSAANGAFSGAKFM